jgi:hypothetical protein
MGSYVTLDSKGSYVVLNVKDTHIARCYYAERHVLSTIIMLNVIMLSAIMLNVFMLSDVMLSVMAPFKHRYDNDISQNKEIKVFVTFL